MATPAQTTAGSFWRELGALGRERISQIDRQAWRRFLLALFALALSFFLALYATALREAGRTEVAACLAGLALLVAAGLAATNAPPLARPPPPAPPGRPTGSESP